MLIYLDNEAGRIYIVMEYCEGGDLSKILTNTHTHISPCVQILDWLVQICLALQYLHENKILHRDIKPQVCTDKILILFFLFFPPQADVMQRHIIHAVSMTGNPPHISEKYSVELRELIRQMLSRDPKDRPSAEEILAKPFLEDSINTFDKAYNKHYKDLEALVSEWGRITDSMESAHYSATAGSLSGSVIGAAGGITALVGLILAPFTLGASLVVTGVGVGVGVAGGVTGAASTITNTVQQKSFRESLEQIQQKYKYVSEPILTPLNTLRKVLRKITKFSFFFGTSTFDNVQISCNLDKRNMLCATQLMNLGLLANVSRIATQTARVGRVVAEAVSGVLSGLLVILDVAFIVMDSVDIHQMRQGKVDDPEKVTSSVLKSIAEMRRTHNELCDVQKEMQKTREELKDYIELAKDDREIDNDLNSLNI
uniref:Serine/threonine-protein kinase Nek1-like n=1 Tax=Sinocyclocheilus rhinocerous TaxID=307959 RepID=A0A673HFQ0_9TELE